MYLELFCQFVSVQSCRQVDITWSNSSDACFLAFFFVLSLLTAEFE